MSTIPKSVIVVLMLLLLLANTATASHSAFKMAIDPGQMTSDASESDAIFPCHKSNGVDSGQQGNTGFFGCALDCCNADCSSCPTVSSAATTASTPVNDSNSRHRFRLLTGAITQAHSINLYRPPITS